MTLIRQNQKDEKLRSLCDQEGHKAPSPSPSLPIYPLPPNAPPAKVTCIVLARRHATPPSFLPSLPEAAERVFLILVPDHTC